MIRMDESTYRGGRRETGNRQSTLVTTGCFVLPEDTFEACKLVQPSAEGEYQLSEAVSLLARAGYAIATVSVGERVNVNTPGDIERAEALVQD